MSKVTLQMEFTYDNGDLLAYLQNEGSLQWYDVSDSAMTAGEYITQYLFDEINTDYSGIKFDGKFKIVDKEY